MELFAIAGGDGPTCEAALHCCGCFPILPLLILLAGMTAYRNIVWPACLALLISGLPYVLLLQMVTGYEPSDDGDVMADQAVGRQTVRFYAILTAFSGLSVLAAAVRLLAQRRASSTAPGKSENIEDSATTKADKPGAGGFSE